jgi:hypothetical protein
MPESSDGGRPVPSGGETESHSRSQEDAAQSHRRGNRGRNNQMQRQFRSDCTDLQDVVFLIGSTDFDKHLKRIAEYVSRTYKGTKDFRLAMINMELPDLVAPTPPTAQSDGSFDKLEMAVFLQDRQNHLKIKEQRADVLGKVFALLIGQCEKPLRDRMEAESGWEGINDGNDVIALLKLIKRCIHSQQTSRHPTQAYYDAVLKFMQYRQGPNMPVSEYYSKVKELASVIDLEGGTVGMRKHRVKHFLSTIAKDSKAPTEAEIKKAEEACRSEYLAVHLIMGADSNRFGQLQIDIQNRYTSNPEHGDYPADLERAYLMLQSYKCPANRNRSDAHESGAAFVSADQGGRGGHEGRGGRGGRGRGRGRGQSGRGGNSQGVTGSTDEESQSPNSSSQEQPNNNNSQQVPPYSSRFSSSIPDYQMDITHCELAFQQSNNIIPRDWLLLDTCSTVNLISNHQMLRDVHIVDKTVHVRCTAGITTTNQMGTLGNFPEPVWYNPSGIANILSLNSME